jgi:Type I restriction enzyme R protein N terminus (HSDR_N)/Restriction endonuclease
MSNENLLLKLLRSLPDQSFGSEVEFARRLIPQFAQALGYSETETFYEYGAASRYRADVVFSSSIDSKPWIVIELKGPKIRVVEDWIYQVKRYLDEFHCPLGVVVSPELLIIVSDKSSQRFDLRALTANDSRVILERLVRSAQTLVADSPVLAKGGVVELIANVESAKTNDEKGKALESLAQFLFESVPSLRCKYRNLETRSSEIDLVIEYDRSKGAIPLFEELGRYCLVECKNWSKPVGVSPVRDFMGKLDKCKVKLGIILAKNGVTGVDSGADALREIQSRYDRDGAYVLVFSLEDLKVIQDSAEFCDVLDFKADSLRFDGAL